MLVAGGSSATAGVGRVSDYAKVTVILAFSGGVV